jgi:hypothetical protein
MNMCGMGCALYIRCALSIHQQECRKSLGCALSIGKYGNLFQWSVNTSHLLFPNQHFCLTLASYATNGMNSVQTADWTTGTTTLLLNGQLYANLLLDDIMVYKITTCTSLLEPWSKSRFSYISQWLFHWFSPFGERPTLDVTSFNSFMVLHTCV